MVNRFAAVGLVGIAAVAMTPAQGVSAARIRTGGTLVADVQISSASGDGPPEDLDGGSNDVFGDFGDGDDLDADYIWDESASDSYAGERFLAAVDGSQIDSGSVEVDELEAQTVTPAVKPGYQFASVSGGQACGGRGFNYSRYWRGELPEGDATALECVAGYRCETKGSSPYLWCQQYAIPPFGQCAGFRFYTWFQCIEGTTCTLVDSSSAKCIPL